MCASKQSRLVAEPIHVSRETRIMSAAAKLGQQGGSAIIIFPFMALLVFSIAPAPLVAQASDHPPLLTNGRNQFTVLESPLPVPMAPIEAENGDLLNLGRFSGKGILLNYWATWCPPLCR